MNQLGKEYGTLCISGAKPELDRGSDQAPQQGQDKLQQVLSQQQAIRRSVHE